MTEVTTYKPITGKLALCPIKVNKEYRDRWNIHTSDFLLLTKDDEIQNNNTLYRVGGLGSPDLAAPYFMLLKHVEAHYPDSITKDTRQKRHMESRWVIIDRQGKERVEFEQFAHPDLIKNSCLYTLNNQFYNIETGECYGTSYTSMQSLEYLFIDRSYDSDKKKRGILRINKKDGSTTLYTNEKDNL